MGDVVQGKFGRRTVESTHNETVVGVSDPTDEDVHAAITEALHGDGAGPDAVPFKPPVLRSKPLLASGETGRGSSDRPPGCPEP